MFCQVIVDITADEVDRVFTYRVPENMALCPGMRVHVPFGRQKRIEGVVVEMVESCDLPAERVKEIGRRGAVYHLQIEVGTETQKTLHPSA